MTIDKVISIFLSLKKNSGLTYGSQSRIMRVFGKRHEGKDISEITQDDVRAYVVSRAHTYKRDYFQMLKLFFNWAVRAEYLDKSPMWERISFPQRKRPYVYTRDEIKRLLNAASKRESCSSKLQAEMFRTILLTTYACGLRISEARRLKCCDVDFERKTFVIIDSKFHKSRFVPFTEEFAHILKEFYQHRL